MAGNNRSCFSFFWHTSVHGLFLAFRSLAFGQSVSFVTSSRYSLYSFLSFSSVNKHVAGVVLATVFVSGIVSLVLLGAELLYGGRLFFAPDNIELLRAEDFRGTRYLGSEETVNLSLLVCLLLLLAPSVKKKGRLVILLVVAFVGVMVTRNRTATFAVFSALLFFFLLSRRFVPFLRTLGFVGATLLLAALLTPSLVEQATSAFEGVFNVGGDDTGRWRVLIQLAALEEAFRHPYFGEGFGGYFYLDVPELGNAVEAPPHSAYIHLFWKAGVFAAILAFAALTSLVVRVLKKIRTFHKGTEQIKVALEVCVVLLLAQFPYGLAFNFSLFLGLYCGYALILLRNLDASAATQPSSRAD